MNTPLFDRAMLLKLAAVFTLIGAVAAVLPIPRFEAEINSFDTESSLEKATAVRFSTIEQAW
ncbi:hypothetical protein H6F86_00715 [Phormidium sp. FACHB-592]|uniref:Uncharacterized protein n=1 Tax=Stenomitos frigidus AS-A4 TaxID=2933935 RepID=A0ABV0KM66_9CYAN|nr:MULTISPECIES: hypothetical protein [Cyanophyceae]MBD2038777.1 hypothetical protein [Leptolyngbya sp. FACHB-321]MBD2072457.1 hypothetical protein [Phormidium sp. FACHB-592]